MTEYSCNTCEWKGNVDGAMMHYFTNQHHDKFTVHGTDDD